MNKKNLFIFSVILSVFSTNVWADLKTDRAVVRNDGSEQIVAIARFQEPIEGDLYIATQVNGALTFIANEGNSFSSAPVPFRANGLFSEDVVVLNISGLNVPPGRYPLYKVVAQPGTDPLDFNNWIGGLGGLRSINFIIGLPSDVTLDLDDDGFPDDDLNRDGFHDDDIDRDGFHDGDRDRDGFDDASRKRDKVRDRTETSDDDLNRRRVRDRDSSGSGEESQDSSDENRRTRTSGRL